MRAPRRTAAPSVGNASDSSKELLEGMLVGPFDDEARETGRLGMNSGARAPRLLRPGGGARLEQMGSKITVVRREGQEGDVVAKV